MATTDRDQGTHTTHLPDDLRTPVPQDLGLEMVKYTNFAAPDAPLAIARILVRYPTGSDEVMRWLNQNVGAQFARAVGELLPKAAGEMTSGTTQLAGEPVTVNYVSNTSDAVMALTRFVTIGEVTGTTIDEMVAHIIAKANGHPIGHLEITGHGSPGMMQISAHDELLPDLPPDNLAVLAQLRPHFGPGAEVVLGGCEVGAAAKGERLLAQLATIWGVKVRAGVPFQRVFPGIEGSEVEAVPNATGTDIHTKESRLNQLWRMDPDFHADDEKMRMLSGFSREDLARMTPTNRYNAVTQLLGGYTSAKEGEMIVLLFETATPHARRELYRYVEGHAWSGRFVDKLFNKDGLASSLGHDQIARLRTLLED